MLQYRVVSTSYYLRRWIHTGQHHVETIRAKARIHCRVREGMYQGGEVKVLVCV